MVPYYIIIALVITLITVLKEFIIGTRIYDYAINAAFILGWIGAMFPTSIYYTISLAIVIVLFILSHVFWGRPTVNGGNGAFTFSEANADENGIVPFMQGYTGKVVSEMQGGYLGTTIKDGSPVEIIVHSDEELQPGDEFEILGASGTKIIAKKRNN